MGWFPSIMAIFAMLTARVSFMEVIVPFYIEVV